MEDKSQLLKPMLAATIISFVAVFFLFSNPSRIRVAQPMVDGGGHYTVDLKFDDTVIAEIHMNRIPSFQVSCYRSGFSIANS